MPMRPHSANQRGGNAARKLRPKAGGDDVDVDQYMLLSREDLLSTIIQLKKQSSVLENERSLLKAENRRWEMEYLKQQQRFEKILDPKFSKNSQAVVELRREVEKAGLVRQLKQQINALRHDLMEKDAQYEELRSSVKAGFLAELEAEKEEYYAEVQRLRQLLKEKFAALTVAAGGASHGHGHDKGHGRSREKSREGGRRNGHKSTDHIRKATNPYVSHHLHGPPDEEDEPGMSGPFRRDRPTSAGSVGGHSQPRSQTGTYSRPINKARPSSAGSTGRQASAAPRQTSDVIADITNTPFDREYHAPQEPRQHTGAAASGAMNLRGNHPQEEAPADPQGQDEGPGPEGVDEPPIGDDAEDLDDFIGGLESGNQVFVAPQAAAEVAAAAPPTSASGQSVQAFGQGLDAGSPLFADMQSPAPPPAVASAPTAMPAFKVGDRVEGQFSGGTKWYKGRVYRLIAPSSSDSPRSGPDGQPSPPQYLYHIRYDDGDEEQRVPAERLRLMPGSQPSSPKPKPTAAVRVPAAAPATSSNTGGKPFVAGSLQITALKACITKLSEGDEPDVYVRVQLGRWRSDTSLVKDVKQFGTACYENLDLATDVTAPELQFEPLTVQVWDKNMLTKDLLVGEASVPLLMAFISADSGAPVDISAELLDKRGKVTGTLVVTAAATSGKPAAPEGPPRAYQQAPNAPSGGQSARSAPVTSAAPAPNKKADALSTPSGLNAAAEKEDSDKVALDAKKKRDDIDFMNYLADLSETDFSETEAGAAGRGARIQEAALQHGATNTGEIVTATSPGRKPEDRMQAPPAVKAAQEQNDMADYDDDEFDA